MKTVQLTAKEIDLIDRLLSAVLTQFNHEESGTKYAGFSYRDTSKFTQAAAKNFGDRSTINALARKLL